MSKKFIKAKRPIHFTSSLEDQKRFLDEQRAKGNKVTPITIPESVKPSDRDSYVAFLMAKHRFSDSTKQFINTVKKALK